jgi:iron complex outermembrane recepter protein
MSFRLLLPAAAYAAAAAAPAAEPPLVRTEPVIVTATRFEERVVDRPLNMTVIPAATLRASPARTVPDILAAEAGIATRELFGNRGAEASVDLRGFGSVGPQNVLVLVDGRRVADIDLSGVQWSGIPLEAVERIEIVRGGGSVLYGDGATAGVINIITRSPVARERGLTLRAGAGSHGAREGTVHAAYAARDSGLGVFGSHFVADGYRRNSDTRQTHALADLRWSGEGGELALKLAAHDEGTRLPGPRTVQPSIGLDELTTDRRGTSAPLDWSQREGRRALLDWHYRTGSMEINLGAGWRDKAQRSYFDFGGFPDFRTADLDVWSLTPRAKLDAPLLGRSSSLIVGVDWYRWDYRLRTTNSPAHISRPVNAVDARQDTVGLYVLHAVQLTAGLSLTAGARREWLRIDAVDRHDATAPGAAFGAAAMPGSQRLHQNAYELGMRYRFAPGGALLWKSARSFRFANVDEIYEISPAFAPEFQFLRPQTAWSHEATVETARPHWRVRGTAFVIDVKDEIRLDPFTTGVGNRNLPPMRRRGLELEALARAYAGVSLAATLTVLDARFRAGVLPGSAFTQQNIALTGKRVPLVSRWQASARAAWSVTSATEVSLLASYVGSQLMENDEPNTFGVAIPAYSLIDVKLAHRSRDWTVVAVINNLLDRKYYNYAVRSQFVADRYSAYPLPERQAMLTLEYRFR